MLQDLELCIKEYPLYEDAYLARGFILLQQNNFELAFKDFEKLVKLKSSEIMGHIGMGDCLKAWRQYSKATEAYSKAINTLQQNYKNSPNYEQLYIRCYVKRGFSSYRDSKFVQALSDF